MSAKNADEIRIEHAILWREIWHEIDPASHTRDSNLAAKRTLPNKNLLTDAARRKGPYAHWLVEAVIMQAMLNVSKALQTDIEDFVPTTQPRPVEQPASGGDLSGV